MMPYQEGDRPKREFVTGKPFELWTPTERIKLLRIGMTEIGMATYKTVRNKSGVLVSAYKSCEYGCSPTIWRKGDITREEHSTLSLPGSEGLHSKGFGSSEILQNAVRRQPEYLVLLWMSSAHYLSSSIDDYELKASEYLVLDAVSLNIDLGNELRNLVRSCGLIDKAIMQRIGSTAKSWKDVIRILSNNSF